MTAISSPNKTWCAERSTSRTLTSNESNPKPSAFHACCKPESPSGCTQLGTETHTLHYWSFGPAFLGYTWGGETEMPRLISDTCRGCAHWFWCRCGIIFLGGRQALPPCLITAASVGRKPWVLAPVHRRWKTRLKAGCQALSGSRALALPNEPYCLSIPEARGGGGSIWFSSV